MDQEQEPIAVVGMACRLPGGVDSPSALWEVLSKKQTTYGPVPQSRFNHSSFYHSASTLRLGSLSVPGGHFLNGDPIDAFDASFFHILPLEVNSIDPQQRMLLEVTWECLESAGVLPESLQGKNVGVYVGAWTSDYEGLQRANVMAEGKGVMESAWITGTGRAILSNRISYIYDFKGPSMTIDTGCSASGIALHMACQQLRDPTGETHSAIVGGTNLLITPEIFMAMGAIGVISATGPSKSFDEAADGYGRAEGVNCVYLKRLSDALKDGDPIRALIRASAANSDGRTMGLVSPSSEAQEMAVRQAYAAAGITNFDQTAFVECHGTGTQAGDPVEAKSMGRVFGSTRQDGDPLFIGSTKPHMGHSEAASALTSVIKAVLALEAGKIPPSIGFSKPHPDIRFDEWNLKIPLDLTPWPKNKSVRRISVNSYGYGGSNVHIVFDDVDSYIKKHSNLGLCKLNSSLSSKKEFISSYSSQNIGNEALQYPTKTALSRPYLLPFSAQSDSGLKSYIKDLVNILKEKSSPQNLLPDLAYTLGVRRSFHSNRSYGVFPVSSTFIDNFSEFVEDMKSCREAFDGDEPRIGFIFTGQGAQWAGMGRELLSAFPLTLRTLEQLQSALSTLPNPPDWNLSEELEKPTNTTRINNAQFSQVLCTALQICLVNLLLHWNIQPTSVVGHSSGEIAASYASGLLTAEQAIIVAYYRGYACSKTAGTVEGAMLAVGLGKDETLPMLSVYEGKVGVACVNSPKSITLSGDTQYIKEIQKVFEERGVFVRYLKVPLAYHSHHMQPIGEVYLNLLLNTTRLVPSMETCARCSMVSSVTGEILDSTTLTTHYWRQNLESPVIFSDAVKLMVQNSKINTIIEVGPHGTLASAIRDIRNGMGLQPTQLEYIPTLIREKCAASAVLEMAGSLYGLGYLKLNFEAVNGVDQSGRPSTETEKVLMVDSPQYECRKIVVDLPSYPWDHSQKYWVEGQRTKDWRFRKHARHDLLGSRIPGNDISEPQWTNMLSVVNAPWIKDHVVLGNVVVPAAAYIAMAIEALTQHLEFLGEYKPEDAFLLRDIAILKPLILETTTGGNVVSAVRGTQLYVTLRQKQLNLMDESKWFEFTVRTMDGQRSGVAKHCHGLISTTPRKRTSRTPSIFTNEKQKGTLRRISQAALYRAMTEVGLNYGPNFVGLENVESRVNAYEMVGESKIFSLRGATSPDSKADFETHTAQDAVSEGEIPSHGEDAKSLNSSGLTDKDLKPPQNEIQATNARVTSDMSELVHRLQLEGEKHVDSRYLLHPVNIDHVLQLSYATLCKGRLSSMTELLIPMMIQEVYVAAPNAGTVKLDIHTKIEMFQYRLTPKRNWAAAYDAEGDIILYFRDMHGMNSMIRKPRRRNEPDICRMGWHASFDFVDNGGDITHKSTLAELNKCTYPSRLERLLQFLSLIAAEISHLIVDLEPVAGHLWQHLIPYVNHVLSADIQQHIKQQCSGFLDIHSMTSIERQAEIERLASILLEKEVRAQSMYLIYKNILPLLRGEIDALQMFTSLDNPWERLMTGKYTPDEASRPHRLKSYKDTLFSMIPNTMPYADIIEIGGGSGANTEQFLEILTTDQRLGPAIRKYNSYTFTDLSVAFVSKAKERFQSHTGMCFQVLDITKDPVEQGFQAGSYDIVCAANVLHATTDIALSLAHIIKLLRPGGKLILSELLGDFIPALDYPFIMGTLKSFWSSIVNDKNTSRVSPLLSANEWLEALEATGFRNCMYEMNFALDGGVGFFTAVTRAVPENLPMQPSSPIIIVYREPVGSLLEQVTKALDSAFGKPITSISFDSTSFESIPHASFLVSIIETNSSLLYDISALDYAKFHRLISCPTPLLWITSGVHISAKNPKGALISGLTRSFRNELVNPKLQLLDLSTDDPKEMARHIKRVLGHLMERELVYSALLKRERVMGLDWEFCEYNGQIYVPRLKPDYETRVKYLPQSECLIHTIEPFSQEKNLALVCPQRGILSSLVFEEVSLPSVLPSDYLEVSPQFIAINFHDIASAMGLIPSKVFGIEYYGTVTRVGSSVTELHEGDQVIGIFPTGFGNRIQVPRDSVEKPPVGLDPASAAGSIIVYLTVLRGLKHLAKLRKGEKLLIHSAAGGVGIAAINYAKKVGAEIFVTCGSEAKRTFLNETHGIPLGQIFSSRDVSFGQGIMEATNYEGVDVILNSLSGELLAESWSCLAPYGRFIEIGKRDLLMSGNLNLNGFLGNRSYAAVDLSEWLEQGRDNDERKRSALKELFTLYFNGYLPPIQPITQFPISEVESAMRHMAGGTHIGKIVISVEPEALVKVSQRALPPNFDPAGTYILIGGLGGIGRSLAVWMAEKGAKHLTFMSRSGLLAKEDEEVLATLHDIKALGCDCAIHSCDIGGEASEVEEALLIISKEKPIRGILHAAMVIKDALVEKMSHEEFLVPLRCKVKGLLNIQFALDNNPSLATLDWFVILGSASATMGFPGQASYAAAGAFEDAFVQFRRAKNQIASILDLGIVSDVGYVHRNMALDKIHMEPLRKAAAYTELSPIFVHKAFEMAIDACHKQVPAARCGQHSKDSPLLGAEKTSEMEFYQDQSQFFLGIDLFNLARILKKHPTSFADAKWGITYSTSLGISEILGSDGAGMGFDDLFNVQNPFKDGVESRPAEEVIDEVTGLIIRKTAVMTMIDVNDIKPGHSLQKYGMDSLVAVELKNWLFKACMVEIGVADIMAAKTIRDLAAKAYEVYMKSRVTEEHGE